ncbi:MAG: hypothetical protein OXG25_02065 [Gammaproteobacteria bacterium]|nr:hypothetical protein [Gammaproteobacteria bacterium]
MRTITKREKPLTLIATRWGSIEDVRHESTCLTSKNESIMLSAYNFLQQQERFDEFVEV